MHVHKAHATASPPRNCHVTAPQVGASVEDYMEHLDAMMDGIPRALLVAGQKDADVITMYS